MIEKKAKEERQTDRQTETERDFTKTLCALKVIGLEVSYGTLWASVQRNDMSAGSIVVYPVAQRCQRPY